MNEFIKAIRDCDLKDLGSIGYPFTWSNRRFGPHIIEEKLDRFLCNNNWGNNFQEKAGRNLISWSSNHRPILMEVVEKRKGKRFMKRTFPRVHYEEMWSSYEKCKEIVRQE